MRMLLLYLLVLLGINDRFTATQSRDADTIENTEATATDVDEEALSEGNKSEPLYDKTTFDNIKEALKAERGISDVVLAVINTSTVLRCRPDKNFSNSDGQNGVKDQ
ncbi:unnamed protein product [Hydatigera taeniaeformis]|uniref:Secreted protein n=1 Tax=Hydatigena taeniaeformis TaxID=6205 RepID=A0A0R3WM53_HYDTA|nr:unnamed protein product [Hydatigera taeniaeformis]